MKALPISCTRLSCFFRFFLLDEFVVTKCDAKDSGISLGSVHVFFMFVFQCFYTAEVAILDIKTYIISF